MEITENILLERQRYLINLLIENTRKLNEIKKVSIKHITGKDELTDVYFNVDFWENIDVKENPINLDAAFKKVTIKPEAQKIKSVLNFDSVEDKIAKEKKAIEDYIEKIIKIQFAKAKEKTKNKETEIFAKNILGFDEKTNEYIDKLIELNNEKLAKQNKVVLAIFDLSDMD